MARDSPELEMYSRLLSHLQNSSKQKKPDIYEGFVTDIAVLQSINKDMVKLVETDLKSILPSILLFSVNKDLDVRTAVVKCFDTFSGILNKKPIIKTEPWWKEVESSIMAQDFNMHLIKLVETTTDDTWPHIWAFVISLIVYDEQMHGTAINSLLKVVEIAFKLSRKHETVLEKAYYCWNRLIDIFCVHPRIVTSQKLIELLVRPLSTNLSLKCPKLKLETWSNLVHKVGFICGNTKCKLVIEPFIDFAYLKDNDSLCQLYPAECIRAFRDIIREKKVYRYCITKIMSALVPVLQSDLSEDLNECIIEIWTSVIDNAKELDRSNQNDYITELVNKLPQVLQIDRPALNDALIKVTLEKKVFNRDNMKMFILSQVPVMPIISSLMKYNEFQRHFFTPIVSDLLEHFLEAQNKKSQNNVELEIWDLVCEVFILWLKSLPLPQESSAIDAELLCSMLLVPLLSKQWSVPVQRTWNAVMEYTLIIVPSNNYLLQFIDRFYKELDDSHINVDFAVEFCTFLSNKDKSVFKFLMPTFSLISKCLPSKDPKPLMDLLVLVENSIRFIPKQDLIKLLTELMSNCNSYGQPYDLRIKTKITKLQRKLFTLKDPNEGSKEQDGQLSKSQEKEQQNGQKTRSPLMAQSNFLQRLAKAEEKKIKKRATMSSIFCDIHSHEGAETCSLEKNDDNQLDEDSPIKKTPLISKDDKNELNKEEEKDADEKKILLMNGRSSPVIPSVVTVVTTPSRKRSVKQPETVLSQESRKPVTKATPPPPSYFEDDAQDYVIVPPKPKSTPLTEHQKEVMTKRRADIPALYQDLSQDTQSLNSLSLKEIATLKEIKLNDTAKSSDLTAVKDDKEESNNTRIKSDEDKKKEQAEEMIIENGEITIADVSQDIINDTQSQYDSCINLSLTPTKQASIPTQKNLLNKFNLLESDENGDDKKVDEEDEVEKENKIVNIDEVTSHRSTIKRRSMRKSSNKYISKKTDEVTKTKTKKDTSESFPQSLEPTPKGKIKKSSETLVKCVDETSLSKIKNNISETLKKDLETDAEGKQNDDTSEGEVRSIQNVEFLLKNKDSETLLNHSENKKSETAEILADNSVNSIVEYTDVEKINKLENLDRSFIADKSDSEDTQERSSILVDKNSTDVSLKIISVVSTADAEELVEIPVKNCGNNSKIMEVSETSIDTSKHPCNSATNNGTSEMPFNVSEISGEKTSTETLSSDVKNTSTEFISTFAEDESSQTELNKLRDHTESSMMLVSSVAGDYTTSENKLLIITQCTKESSKIDEPSNVLNSAYENSLGSNIIAQDVNEKIAKCNNEVIEIDDKCETDEVMVEIKTEEDEDIDQNSSGDSNAASWSMVTPEKKSRKRRVSEVSAEKFSPKLLRSKRLSLPKQTPENSAEKNNKKTKPTPKNSSKVNKTNNGIDTLSEDKKNLNKSLTVETNSTAESVTEIADISSFKSATTESVLNSKPTSTSEQETSVDRKSNKRKNQDQTVTPLSQPKKPKGESNSEEASQDSLALLKNNSVKPRKKKVIKSTMKSSPNNLEQWLIKSGKAVVKTSLLSSSDQSAGSQSESKIININSEIQISSSEPKKIIVEMSPVSRGNNNTSTLDEENVITIEELPTEVAVSEVTMDSVGDTVVKIVDPQVQNDSVVISLSSDEEEIPSVLETEEVHQPSVLIQAEDIESIEKQFLEAIKRGVEEEEDNMKRKQEEILRHMTIRQEEDEDLLADSLKCDETEIDRTTNELDKNSNASRVKLESMIYAKYKTTLRRPRRRKRLLRRVKKQDDENDLEEELEEEEDTFEERRERLTTPFRSSGGRSAQMVKMATTEEDPPVTPVRGRRSITPIHLTENWPEGRCEQWVPCMPTPPGVSPSLSILKRKVSPVQSPTSSPNTKKKRVSFLDPPVSKGLLYSKGSDNTGQVQHANIPPGKKPLWKGFEGEPEDKGPSGILKAQDVDGGFGPVEAEDELNAIQEFLNSTPDAPWKDTPHAGDISKIPGIMSCSDPVQNIISRIASQGDEKKLTEELQRLKINTIGGFYSLAVSDIKKLSIRPAKVTTLYNVLKDYFQCQPSSSKKSLPAKFPDDASKCLEDGEKMDFVETQIEVTTLGIEMGIQVDPSEICSDDTLTLQMSQKFSQASQDYCLTPPVMTEPPDLYSDPEAEIKIPSENEIALLFQSDVFIKRAAPYATFSFISKLAAAAADYFGNGPD